MIKCRFTVAKIYYLHEFMCESQKKVIFSYLANMFSDLGAKMGVLVSLDVVG